MKTRVKYIKKNMYEGFYAVQVKKLIFWKTIYTDAIFANVEKFIDKLARIDEFNSKLKSLSKIVYDGYAVRNVFKNRGIAYSINFFESQPSRSKSDNESEIIWEDCNGNIVPTMEIKTKTLFGKECFEPMKLRITIEQIEE
jgi:hypothetical protein